MNLASNRDYNHGAIIRIYIGVNKVLLLLNENGDPSFLFQNLSSYNINNQQAKFHKNLRAGSISVNDLKRKRILTSMTTCSTGSLKLRLTHAIDVEADKDVKYRTRYGRAMRRPKRL